MKNVVKKFLFMKIGQILPGFVKSVKNERLPNGMKKSCESCGTTISVHRDWDNPPKYCKKCNSIYTPKNISCRKCGKSFTISTTLQIKCKERGWDLPSQCRECKQDDLLIKGAIGALRDKYPFALETTIEQRGIIFTDKVAIVRNKETGEIVAEVKMNTEGFISVNRVAVATDLKTGEKTKTYEGVEGFLSPKRIAKTYDADTKLHSNIY